MGAPAAAVAARFAWVGYKDRLPFVGRRRSRPVVAEEPAEESEGDLVDVGPSPPP